MKRLITIFLLFGSHAFATKIYVSNAGSNTGSGTISLPYQTLAKVNSLSLSAGDSIFLRSGDTFRGSLVIKQSGIVVTSYGAGEKPIVSGLVLLHSWTRLSGNIWYCIPDSTLKANCNVLTINGIPQAVGRTRWYAYQSATSTTLTSTSLTGTPNYTGAEVVSRKNSFVSDKAKVTAQSGSTLTVSLSGMQALYNGSNSSLQSGSSGYGFFLQRCASSLDEQGEWYYDKATNRMQLYSLTDPSAAEIKASFVDTLILLSNKTNIVIQNLAIEGAGSYGVEAVSGSNIKVKGCTFNNNTMAVYLWNCNDVEVSGCTIENSFAGAIVAAGNTNLCKRVNVLNNTVHNTGQLIGMGVFNKEFVLRGIVAQVDSQTVNNYLNIIGNRVINTGNGAIQFQGSNVLVRRNVTDSFCNQLDDNGGIYTFINNQSVNTKLYSNRLVDSNFISNAIGAPAGATPGHLDVSGFYMDDQTCNITGLHNTVYNVPGNGIQMNNPLNMNIRDNTVFNCSYLVFINKKTYGDISGVTVKNNVLYQKTPSQYLYYYTNADLTSPPMTITEALQGFVQSDSNYVSNQMFAGFGYYYKKTATSGYTFPVALTLAQWRTIYNHSLHSILPAAVVTPSNIDLAVNPTDTTLIVRFAGLSKVDARGEVFNNEMPVPAWSSRVIINNGEAPVLNLPPFANAGADRIITLPANSLTLTGSGSDSDGVVTGYQWGQIDGPADATTTDRNLAAIDILNLIAGEYHFQLSVTDNSGAVGTSIVKVTVNPAIVVIPAPVAEAGASRIIFLPKDSVQLAGSSVSLNIVSIQWTKVSAPVGATDVIESPNTYATVVTGLTEGTFVYRLTITNNTGATSSNLVQVIVLGERLSGILIHGWIFITN